MAELKQVNTEFNESSQEASSMRQMPHNVDAEQIVLGSILINNEAINKVADFLMSEHFYMPVHQKLYELIQSFYDKGIIADPVTLKSNLQGDEAFEAVGEEKYLGELLSRAAGTINLKDYGMFIYNTYVSRQLINVSQETLDTCYNAKGDEPASRQIEVPEAKLFQLASEGQAESSFAALKGAVIDSVKTAEIASRNQDSISGIPTQFTDMDNLLGGLNKPDLMILAARPSMGKTALSLNFTLNAAEALQEKHERELEAFRNSENRDNKDLEPKCGSVGFISLEMSAEQLATRMLSMKTGINAANIRRGKLSRHENNDEFSKLVQASNELSQVPIFIDDTPALSITAVRTRARRLKRKYNLEFLVVDYLQLLRGTSKQSAENRVQEISEITMGLKAIAKELDIPVMALSQLSRQVEQRADHRPQLSDLRESGSIEQDADIVMFIYREAYYKEREKPSDDNIEAMQQWQEVMSRIDNVSEIIIAKNRNGPINNVKLFFDKNTTRFSDFTGEEYHEM